MDEDTKKEIAVFRFGVIADIVGRKLARGEKERIVREKASCRWEIPFSTRTRISRMSSFFELDRIGFFCASIFRSSLPVSQSLSKRISSSPSALPIESSRQP